jgi:hypothetical protein
VLSAADLKYSELASASRPRSKSPLTASQLRHPPGRVMLSRTIQRAAIWPLTMKASS